ncbi:MAG: M23 family metallopeptidase [Marinilabiliaceae bacterium]|nr:M23 family metallopeptidase [Marinilabiliaceae bacterium]
MVQKKQSRLWRKLRIAVFSDTSYEQLFSLLLTPFSVLFTIVLLGILIISGVTVLIAFTGLREYIPGYPTGEERRMIMDNLHRTDSLLEEIMLRDHLINDMRCVLADDLPIEAWDRDSVVNSIHRSRRQDISFEKSEADSLFRMQIEAEDKYNVSQTYEEEVDTRLEMMFLYVPLRGVVTSKVGEVDGHYGIDVASVEGAPVASILDGTVIFSEWTVETGYVIQIQHDNQLVSIYKHNSKLLKRAGNRVQAGEIIALTGSSGELSTAPHLHFEMWYQGVPLNPENYISFE